MNNEQLHYNNKNVNDGNNESMSDNKLNLSCAKALGAEVPPAFISGAWRFPKEIEEGTGPIGKCAYMLREMHFHDSYDWAMLLVKAALAKDMYRAVGIWTYKLWEEFPTPRQISEDFVKALS